MCTLAEAPPTVNTVHASNLPFLVRLASMVTTAPLGTSPAGESAAPSRSTVSEAPSGVLARDTQRKLSALTYGTLKRIWLERLNGSAFLLASDSASGCLKPRPSSANLLLGRGRAGQPGLLPTSTRTPCASAPCHR